MTLDRDQVKSALPAYEIGGELGRGGWGVVLEARHVRLDRRVAVKQLPRAFGADPSVRARFVAEARVLASLDHPHIVPVYDYVEVDGLCLLVMEKLPGGTLWDRFISEGMTMESSCAVVLAACAGLHAAHQHGVLHRDVKPENLMFSASNVLKVTDFGIAKVVGGSRTMATRAGEVLGTPSYMAPEHARGETLGPPADVYATGVLLYELLSGRLPFSDDGDALAVLYRHVHESPTPLRDVAPLVPPAVAEVVMRSLASHPEDRFETAEAFGVALGDAASTAWGPGWATARTNVTVMGSAPIVAAIERSSSFSAPPAGRAPATVVTDGVTGPSTPAPPTAAVRPTTGGQSRHGVPAAPESPGELSLHEIPAVDAPPPPGRHRPRWPLPVAAAIVVVLAGLAATTLGGGGSGDPQPPPSSTPTTPTTPTTTAGERIVFRDDFSSSTSGWTQFDDDTARIGYSSGTYVITVRQPGFRVYSDSALEGAAFRQDLVALGDVAVEVAADKISAPPAIYGLLCRRQQSRNDYYVGGLDSSGRAVILKLAGGPPRTIAEAPLAQAAQSGRRQLRLECVGGAGGQVTVRLVVDGTPAVEVSDPAGLGPGAVGLFVSSEAQAGSQVLFDDFAVKSPT